MRTLEHRIFRDVCKVGSPVRHGVDCRAVTVVVEDRSFTFISFVSVGELDLSETGRATPSSTCLVPR